MSLGDGEGIERVVSGGGDGDAAGDALLACTGEHALDAALSCRGLQVGEGEVAVCIDHRARVGSALAPYNKP